MIDNGNIYFLNSLLTTYDARLYNLPFSKTNELLDGMNIIKRQLFLKIYYIGTQYIDDCWFLLYFSTYELLKKM